MEKVHAVVRAVRAVYERFKPLIWFIAGALAVAVADALKGEL